MQMVIASEKMATLIVHVKWVTPGRLLGSNTQLQESMQMELLITDRHC